MRRRGRHATAGGGPVVPGFVILAVAAVFLGAIWVGGKAATPDPSTGAPSERGGSECVSLDVAVAPAVASVVLDSLERLRQEPDCVEARVSQMSSAGVKAAAARGVGIPQVWVSDAPAWSESLLAQVQTQGQSLALTVGGTIATSPVVLGLPPQLAETAGPGPKPWVEALVNVPLTSRSPADSTAASLAFCAVYQQFGNIEGGAEAMSEAYFQIVQGADPSATVESLGVADGAQARAFPATEQELYAFNLANPDAQVAAITPAEGAPMAEYQVVRVGDLTAEERAAADAVERVLSAGEAVAALREAGFRVAGRPKGSLVEGVPQTLPGAPPAIELEAFDHMRGEWNRVSRDLSLLAVVDVSGSMREPVGRNTRIGLAARAVGEAVERMTARSAAGLWVFSTAQSGARKDYRSVVPVQRLGDGDGGHRGSVLAATRRLPDQLTGDTGLYDTIWAAYSAALSRSEKDTDREAVVVVLTDGKNEDTTGGLSEDQLVDRLSTAIAKEPGRVQLALLGMGEGPDQEALARVAKAARGTSAIARNAEDIVPLFANAVWNADQPE